MHCAHMIHFLGRPRVWALEPTAVTARGLCRFVESWSALSLRAAYFKTSSYIHTVLKKGISGRESLGACILNKLFFSVVTGWLGGRWPVLSPWGADGAPAQRPVLLRPCPPSSPRVAAASTSKVTAHTAALPGDRSHTRPPVKSLRADPFAIQRIPEFFK